MSTARKTLIAMLTTAACLAFGVALAAFGPRPADHVRDSIAATRAACAAVAPAVGYTLSDYEKRVCALVR